MKYLKKYESPNNIKTSIGFEQMCDNDYQITFLYDDKDDIYVLYGCECHAGVASHYKVSNDRWRDVSGRLFPDHKVITFWKYPKDKKELMKVIENINEKITSQEYVGRKELEPTFLEKHGVIDDTWRLEMPVSISNTMEEEKKMVGEDRVSDEFIKFKDYVNKVERSEDEMNIIHNLDPKEKNKKLRELGYKPKTPSPWKKHMKPFESFSV